MAWVGAAGQVLAGIKLPVRSLAIGAGQSAFALVR